MSATWTIAIEEWRLLWRDRVAATALALLLALVAWAAGAAWVQHKQVAAERQHDQARALHEFDAQPDRHPHRMVHYGHFVFRPPSPLAAFDPGIDPYTGHTLYLEGHRQNSANFADVSQSSLLLRFGQLTPAFMLQVLAPLLLVFLGHAAVARERESGTLRALLAQGVAPARIVGGKLLALGGVAALVMLPALLALAAIALAAPGQAGPAAWLALAYAAWLLVWVMGIVAVSSMFKRGRDALMALLAVWVVLVVLVPRLAVDIAGAGKPLTTRFESSIQVARDLAALGDSHNPDDPYFGAFREKLLAEHGVSRIEDLPLNYKGLLGMEGERLTSELFERQARAGDEQQQAQSRAVDAFAILSPVLALRRVSMALAGTDLPAYRHFLAQAEQHRYRLVQSLNRLQAEAMRYAQDRSSRDNRISRDHWQGLADFRFEPFPQSQALRGAARSAGILLLWLALPAVLLVVATRRLGGDA